MKENNDSGVSPVVGVMLMVVVTVIVAAVVAMFASGFTGGTEASPTVKITYLGSVQGDNFEDGYAGEIGFLFQVDGGEKISFSDIGFSLMEESRTIANETTFSMFDAPNNVASHATLVPGSALLYPNSKSTSDVNSLIYRFKKVGAMNGANQATITLQKATSYHTLESGDRFIVYVDEIRKTDSRYNTAVVLVNRYGAGEAYFSEGEFEIGPGTTWSFKDTASGKVISTGTLLGKIYETI